MSPMQAVPPVLLERVCDAEKSKMEAGEHMRYTAELIQQHGEQFMLTHKHYPGCGTRFQWYGVFNCFCPECGRAYNIRIEDYKAGLYTPQKE